jgi:hypothetical protein
MNLDEWLVKMKQRYQRNGWDFIELKDTEEVATLIFGLGEHRFEETFHKKIINRINLEMKSFGYFISKYDDNGNIIDIYNQNFKSGFHTNFKKRDNKFLVYINGINKICSPSFWRKEEKIAIRHFMTLREFIILENLKSDPVHRLNVLLNPDDFFDYSYIYSRGYKEMQI